MENLQNTFNLPENLKSYESKYDKFVQEKNYYNLLLSIKTDLRKILRKNQLNDYISLLFFAANLFSKNSENQNSITLLTEIFEEIEKSNNFTEKNINNLLNFQENFTQKLNNLLRLYPSIFTEDKIIMRKFLVICDTKKFQENSEEQKKIFRTFAELCLKQKDFLYAYKISLKTKDFNLINLSAEGLSNGFLPTEKEYFNARTTLELLIKRDIPIAKEFIKSKIDHGNNLQNNNPILNFAYLLCFLLGKSEKNFAENFSNFEKLFKKYFNAIENEGTMKKYVNAISKEYFDKEIIKEEENTNGKNPMENLMKMFGA